VSPVSALPAWRGRLIDIVAGSLVGGLVGLVAAWNLAIFMGVEGGYEASVWDAFEHSLASGILVTGALLGGPLAGVWVARRQRRKRDLESDVRRSRTTSRMS